MKKRLITTFGMVLVAVSLPAVAGPNWDVIHDAEANRVLHKHLSGEEVLPLDHGPRAISTPWLNKERLAALHAEQKEKSVIVSVHTKHISTHS